jgi:hypothetical protein
METERSSKTFLMSTILQGVTLQDNNIQHLAGECEGKECSGDDEAEGRIILKWPLKKYDVGKWIGFISLSRLCLYISKMILPFQVIRLTLKVKSSIIWDMCSPVKMN